MFQGQTSERSATETETGASPEGETPGQSQRRRLLPARDRYVLALRSAGIELTWAADLLAWILDHLFPLGDPADRARDGEQHGEHADREAHRLEGDAGIEVDVGIELLLDEILI